MGMRRDAVSAFLCVSSAAATPALPARGLLAAPRACSQPHSNTTTTTPAHIAQCLRVSDFPTLSSVLQLPRYTLTIIDSNPSACILSARSAAARKGAQLISVRYAWFTARQPATSLILFYGGFALIQCSRVAPSDATGCRRICCDFMPLNE